MERQKPHKKLDVWSKIIDLIVHIYEISKGFPREEEFGLKAQLRRAAVSVPSNVSEGLTRRTQKDKLHFEILKPSPFLASRFARVFTLTPVK